MDYEIKQLEKSPIWHKEYLEILQAYEEMHK